MSLSVAPQDIWDKTGFIEEDAPATLLDSNSFIPMSILEIEDYLEEKQVSFDSLTARQQSYIKEAVICLVASKFCKRQGTKIQTEMGSIDDSEFKVKLIGTLENYKKLQLDYFKEYETLLLKAFKTRITYLPFLTVINTDTDGETDV